MNANCKKVPARFPPETRFEVRPVPAARSRAAQEAEFARLEGRLLAEWLVEAVEPEFGSQAKGAANEAAALAWTTPYPLLVFPVLFTERAGAALQRGKRQEEVRRLSREWLMAV